MTCPKAARAMLVEAAGRGARAASEGLVVVAVGCPVPKHLTDLTVRPLLTPAAMVRGMRRVF